MQYFWGRAYLVLNQAWSVLFMACDSHKIPFKQAQGISATDTILYTSILNSIYRLSITGLHVVVNQMAGKTKFKSQF